MDYQEQAKLLEDLEALRDQLQKWSLRLNRRLDPAQHPSPIHNARPDSGHSADQDQLSQEFTHLRLRYKQVQERYAQLHQQVRAG